MFLKRIIILKYVSILFLIVTCKSVNKTDQSQIILDRINIDFDWKFHLGDVKMASSKEFIPENWETVDLPHDWSIGGIIEKKIHP